MQSEQTANEMLRRTKDELKSKAKILDELRLQLEAKDEALAAAQAALQVCLCSKFSTVMVLILHITE
jgi:hypothetical protein